MAFIAQPLLSESLEASDEFKETPVMTLPGPLLGVTSLTNDLWTPEMVVESPLVATFMSTSALPASSNMLVVTSGIV